MIQFRPHTGSSTEPMRSNVIPEWKRESEPTLEVVIESHTSVLKCYFSLSLLDYRVFIIASFKFYFKTLRKKGKRITEIDTGTCTIPRSSEMYKYFRHCNSTTGWNKNDKWCSSKLANQTVLVSIGRWIYRSNLIPNNGDEHFFSTPQYKCYLFLFRQWGTREPGNKNKLQGSSKYMEAFISYLI